MMSPATVNKNRSMCVKREWRPTHQCHHHTVKKSRWQPTMPETHCANLCGDFIRVRISVYGFISCCCRNCECNSISSHNKMGVKSRSIPYEKKKKKKWHQARNIKIVRIVSRISLVSELCCRSPFIAYFMWTLAFRLNCIFIFVQLMAERNDNNHQLNYLS